MTTDERISKLEAQIDRLEAKEAELRNQLAKAQLDQWYGRIEDLELQAHLGAMETQDRIRALTAQVRQLWQDTKRQVDDTASSASDAIDDVRTRIEDLLHDVRQGLVDARKKALAKRPTVKRPAAKKAPAKKTAAKKSTAKRSTAKRSTAKRSTAKRSTAKKSTARKAS
jgi:ElaB/YqjD/DUF883 family membrane-anchored ribosome-binding protein